jgi:hypothetical protein
VLAAAQADPRFRAAFLVDPKAAYKARFGKELLPGEEVEVKKLKDGATALYLPKYQQGLLIPVEDGELSDEMLDKVAGGTGKGQPPLGLEGQIPGGSIPGGTPSGGVMQEPGKGQQPFPGSGSHTLPTYTPGPGGSHPGGGMVEPGKGGSGFGVINGPIG